MAQLVAENAAEVAVGLGTDMRVAVVEFELRVVGISATGCAHDGRLIDTRPDLIGPQIFQLLEIFTTARVRIAGGICPQDNSTEDRPNPDVSDPDGSGAGH